ncbi:hypothetical protein CDAR_434231 [Caerostris darwini]|uniref:Uncharacterized protein n=1 Tax=Caerostris darwini TaxID=1538125 RepID=A0AAV4UA58_9ARAC|nr:hypothetical protein CDAR_434231 [Caerostris darwini]
MIDCSLAVEVFMKVHLEASNLNFKGYGLGSEDADIKCTLLFVSIIVSNYFLPSMLCSGSCCREMRFTSDLDLCRAFLVSWYQSGHLNGMALSITAA